MTIKIYHNPRCSKSRQTLNLLNENGVNPDIEEYTKKSPSVAEIKKLLNMLGFDRVRKLMRTGESIYKELGLKDENDEEKLIRAMNENPILMERPIIVRGNKAVIGRPPENVLSLL
ncbi:MAG: arsenate reductase (glutaredoxin) [Robiginitomaculum sp.]